MRGQWACVPRRDIRAPPRRNVRAPCVAAGGWAMVQVGGGMVELGLAILFLGVLLVAESKRREQLTDLMRRLIDWMESSS